MNYDVIFRSDVKKALVAAPWISDATKAAVWSILDNVPIVDAETLFQQMGLVKEAFDMAKADLVPVVRCEKCKNWRERMTPFEGRIGRCVCGEACMPSYTKPNFYCAYGERRADE